MFCSLIEFGVVLWAVICGRWAFSPSPQSLNPAEPRISAESPVFLENIHVRSVPVSHRHVKIWDVPRQTRFPRLGSEDRATSVCVRELRYVCMLAHTWSWQKLDGGSLEKPSGDSSALANLLHPGGAASLQPCVLGAAAGQAPACSVTRHAFSSAVPLQGCSKWL